jgi:hypothetical protein
MRGRSRGEAFQPARFASAREAVQRGLGSVLTGGEAATQSGVPHAACTLRPALPATLGSTFSTLGPECSSFGPSRLALRIARAPLGHDLVPTFSLGLSHFIHPADQAISV